ncbi:MAG: UDP-3-O-(3-hydroxymyristoyl)glucosamine N-acyltransferase [Janthinobacterium lividum]
MESDVVGDPRFFARSGPYTLAQVAHAAGGSAEANANLTFNGVAPLQSACEQQVSFLHDRRYASVLDTTRAGAVLVPPDLGSRVPTTSVAIRLEATYEGWARVAALFHPVSAALPGTHPLALVSPTATIDASTEVGPFCVIEAGVSIGPGCRIGPYVSIAKGVQIGKDCRIGAHVSISHALIGDRVYLHPGARLGQEGFSFARTSKGFLTIPQLGRVLIEDDVEIGTNSTIDRGSVRDTVIGAGSRIDNLVQIGHNVRLGKCCVVVAQVGISGSTVLEDFVQVGGQAAFTGHVTIGRGAQVGAQAGVISDIAPGAIVLGSPAQPRQDFFRQVATLKRLAKRTSSPPTSSI